MSGEAYPILVERYEPGQSTRAICQSCGIEGTADPEQPGFMDGEWGCACGGWVCFKYAEAEKCPNCGALGFYESALARCCSRRCQLQADYAATLSAPPSVSSPTDAGA